MSLITYPVATDPRAFLPRSVSLSQDVNARSFASPFGGSEQAVDMLNDRWRLSMELPPCSQPEAAKREAFINALRGQVNHTELYHFGRPYPQGTLSSCQGLVYDAPQGADSITIATTAGATLKAGDMLGVDGLLLQCRADCTADANGVLVVPLTNRLRRAVPGLRRASTATYVDGSGVLQTAGVDVPRFQGGQLLVEGGATNLLRQSAGMVASPWSGSVGSVATGQADPFGGTAATQLNATSLGQSKIQDFSTSAISSVCLSMFFKSAGVAGNNARLLIYNVITAAIICHVTVDAGTGVVKASTGTGTVTSVSSLSSGWFRFSIGTANFTTGHTLRAYVYPDAVTATASLLVFGGQVEAGLVPTSYIPTTDAPVTRAADIITPVVWQKPTAPFRLVGRPALRYVPGYSESLALDFVEKVD